MGTYTNRLKKRIQNKGRDIGYCVICGSHGPLSRDHVPPKACNNLNDVELKALLPSAEMAKVGAPSQGGTHYKTLCSECNNTRLGQYYDPFLISLSNEITALVIGAKNRKISLPDKIYPFIKPQRIARAIVGHCLAANAVDETKSGLIPSPINNQLRQYFIDQTSSLPQELDIYYWLYPSRRQVMVKNMGKRSINSKSTVFGHVIKFLPLGFWLVWNKPENVAIRANALLPDKAMKIDDIDQVELNLYHIPALDFPEAPADDEIIAMNSDCAVVATPKVLGR